MRVVAIGLATALATLAARSDPGAQPAPDYARAKQLYDTAQSEYDKAAYVDAIRDFGAAYEITRDAVLFFKLGLANEKAGKCDVALGFYAKYVKEARPTAKYLALTKERVEACKGDWGLIGAVQLGTGSAGSGSGAETGSGTGSATESGSGSASESGSGSAAEPGSGSASESGSGSEVVLTGMGSGSAAVEHRHGRDLPWLMVGGALAFATAGAVLAYSASSSEQDIKDLYVPLSGGGAPTFTPATAQRYQDLVDEGHRYQYLSWGAFGVAAGFGIAATFIFIHDHIEAQRNILVTPVATPSSAGASVTIKF